MGSPSRRSGSLNPHLPQIAEEDSAEHLRRDIDRTLGIDTSRPPRNAFAEEELRLHRHRLAGNAFYQEAFTQRKHTPPTVMHPAFRFDTDLYNIAQALPEWHPDMDNRQRLLEMEEVSPHRARCSNNTTMSSFINAGVEERPASPEIRLAPTPSTSHVATMRNEFEERSAANRHPADSGRDDYITTTRHSPKTTGRSFHHHSKSMEDVDTTKTPVSPKKSLLDRFRPTRRGAVPLQPLPSMNGFDSSLNMPAKARAVLVAPPPSQALPRSPSKKGFWSRRKQSLGEVAGTHPADPVSLKAPPRQAVSLSNRNGLPGYTRSHSLDYVDNTVPPTPPAKDTPPEEKAKHDIVSKPVIALDDNTPTRKTGFLSLNGRTSPNKFGGYSKRDVPRLVTQPSTRSFRASVVPSVMDGNEFDEASWRINALGLDGLDLPADLRHHALDYSPSIYSTAGWGREPIATPNRHRKSKSASDTSTSAMDNISIVYPELARDPSYPSMVALTTPTNKTIIGANIVGTPDLSYAESLRQERLRSPQQEEGIDTVLSEVKDMLRQGRNAPCETSLFHMPQGHASAQVSPLHLQPATFRHNQELHNLNGDYPNLFDSGGHPVLPAATYNPWDVQQESYHSPRQGDRLLRGFQQLKDQKSTATMPGLEYDSGIDVDPKKMTAKDLKKSDHSHNSSTSRTSGKVKEKHELATVSTPNIPSTAKIDTAEGMHSRSKSVKEMVASQQQNEISKRLSDLERLMEKDAISVCHNLSLCSPFTSDFLLQRSISELEERRRLKQEVLFVSKNIPRCSLSGFLTCCTGPQDRLARN